MFTRSVEEILGTERDVHGEGWKSRRLVLAEDGLPFSVHETLVEAGRSLRFTYRAHSETVSASKAGRRSRTLRVDG